VICLIRGHNDAAARARLVKIYEEAGGAFASEFKSLSEAHLDVIAGDVAQDKFGLDNRLYDALAARVDRVIHVAALVNHKLSYANLFDANVLGTAELIRFSLLKKIKSFDFVSTVAVQANLDLSAGNRESAPLKKRVKLTNHYRDYGLPVNVFRGDMMLAHEHYAGQMNDEDMFTRLLFSIIQTGIAPKSFYKLNINGQVQKGHYDGVPVNIVSSVITHVPTNRSNAQHVLNIMNYHADDGCSLDAFVDWIITAGHPVERLNDHTEWFDLFIQKLKTLPPETRSKSVLAISEAFSRPLPTDLPIPGHDNFKSLYRGISEGKDIPHLSERFIQKCLADMTLKGFIS